MTARTITRPYTARRDGITFGPWAAGDVVDLTEEDAAWVQRDSPGLLAEPEAEPPQERAAKPAADRQARGGRNRSA